MLRSLSAPTVCEINHPLLHQKIELKTKMHIFLYFSNDTHLLLPISTFQSQGHKYLKKAAEQNSANIAYFLIYSIYDCYVYF